MKKYKEQWDNYFEGGIAIWSEFGYQYHSYLITKHIVSQLPINKRGKIIQFGTGLGVTVELLCNLFGNERVIGYDLFNPLGHPNIEFFDIETGKLPNLNYDENIAYIEIDTGSISHMKSNRTELLKWALMSIADGGYILTNKGIALELAETKQYIFEIIGLNEFDIPELWKNVHQSRLNTKVILEIKR